MLTWSWPASYSSLRRCANLLRIPVFVSIEFLSSRPASFFDLGHSTSNHGRRDRSRTLAVFTGAISTRSAVMIRLYCVVSWSTSMHSSPEVHSADDLSRLMKSSVLNIFHERLVVVTYTGNGGVRLIVYDTSIWSDRPTSSTAMSTRGESIGATMTSRMPPRSWVGVSTN